jgi:dUTP pyrophosphatase
MKIINKSNNELPSYGTLNSAGLDLRANLKEIITLRPLERILIPTGLHIQLPKGNVGLICPRSGLAIKEGITVLNAPGIIDEDFIGEIKVILINLSNKNVIINNGDRIAQLVITNYFQVKLEETDKLSLTERGEGGFGHTGLN